MNQIIQGSDEWYAIRRGRVTASRLHDVTARVKTGWGASRADYMAELIAERLTGITAPSYSNTAMQWGTDMEPEARSAYEFFKGYEVEIIGFAKHPTIEMSGASPDGLCGTDGMLEIKCPKTATHIDTVLGVPIDGKYIKQMQWGMACANRLWCDFVSYDPRLPPDIGSLHVQRVARDDKLIASLEKDVIDFLAKLDERLATLIKICRGEVKAAA